MSPVTAILKPHTRFRMRRLLMLLAIAVAATRPLSAQIPDKFENLKVLPKDISREQLLATMRNFTLGLGVRCDYCHVEKAGAAPQPGRGPELDFKADDKITKRKARFMLQMVRLLNDTILPKLPRDEHANDQVATTRVQCVTCHRGSPTPKTLDAILVETTNQAGVDSAIATYRKLRETALTSGRYNFGEFTLSEAARQLAAANRNDDAFKLLLLNEEQFPQSGMVDFQLAELYRTLNNKDKAVEYYQKTLQKMPNNQQAKRRLEELQK